MFSKLIFKGAGNKIHKKIKPHTIDEATRESDLRLLWKKVYCDSNKPIHTFDGILVKFYEDMFGHCFYDLQQQYVVILEPQNSGLDYYLLSAYYLN